MAYNINTIGERILIVRQQRGMSLRQVSQASGLDYAMLHRLVCGSATNPKKHILAETVVRLCETLGCSADYLLGLSDRND